MSGAFITTALHSLRVVLARFFPPKPLHKYILILYSEWVWDATWCRVQWAGQTGHVYPRCVCVCAFTARGLLHVPEIVVAVKMRRVEEIRKEETHCRWLHCWAFGLCLPTLSLLPSFFLLSSSILYSPPSFSFLPPSFIPLLPSPFFFRPLFPSFLLLFSALLYVPC